MKKNKNKNNNNYNPLAQLKNELYIPLLIIATFAFGLYFYPQLPDKIPFHWNIHGEVDNWADKSFAVWFLPLLNLGLYHIMLFTPLIDPRKNNYQKFTGAYKIIRIVVHLFLALIYVITILTALGYQIPISIIVKTGVAIILIITGNYLGKLQHNYFIGIKTPWTLASEEVWYKTHRMAAPIWVTLGILDLILSFIDTLWSNILFFATIPILVFVPMLYSYLAFRSYQNK